MSQSSKDCTWWYPIYTVAVLHYWKHQMSFNLTCTCIFLWSQVCGGSKSTGCNSSDVLVGSCQIKKQDRKQNWILGQPNQKLYYYDGMLNLIYGNGTLCHNGDHRTTHITFLCNSSAADDGIGVPEYEKENHCIYNFRWFTKYACPAKVSQTIFYARQTRVIW